LELSIFIPLLKIDDLHEDRGKLIKINTSSIALFYHQGQIYAVENNCPHQGGNLSEGYIHDGKIFCPLHHWSFDLKTGAYSFNASMKIKTYITVIRDGMIYINLNGQDETDNV